MSRAQVKGTSKVTSCVLSSPKNVYSLTGLLCTQPQHKIFQLIPAAPQDISYDLVFAPTISQTEPTRISSLDWWNDEKEAALIKMALTDKWANIKYAVEKSDITEHYGYASGEHFILRGLADQIEGGEDDESPYEESDYEEDEESDDDELADYAYNKYLELSKKAGFS